MLKIIYNMYARIDDIPNNAIFTSKLWLYKIWKYDWRYILKPWKICVFNVWLHAWSIIYFGFYLLTDVAMVYET